MAKSDFKSKKDSNKSHREKKEIVANNEKMQQKMTNSCSSLKVSRSLAKKPKQVKTNLKKLTVGIKKHVEEDKKTLKNK
jgi:hypothetical protein